MQNIHSINTESGTIQFVALSEVLPLFEMTEKLIKTIESTNERFLSVAETQKLFSPQVSRPTLAKWDKEGILKKHFIGGKCVYKYSEIQEAIKTPLRYRRSNNCKY